MPKKVEKSLEKQVELETDKELEVKPKKTKKTKEITEEKKEDLQVVDNATTKKIKKSIVTSIFTQERVLTEATDSAQELYHQAGYGIILDDGRVQLSLSEALYLLEKGKLIILDSKNKPMDNEKLIKKASKLESKFWIRYVVFKDMRNRGYIIKTALKFGADFRVYDRGVKPGEDHARWIVYPVHEGEKFTWFDFAAKNRVAHSTKKRLMMGVVDDENDVTYWEAKWIRP
ncbi:MAG: tRNA-intron lyase [Candidatus Woesearchaeota archaeon]